jgi:hypothetical protein
MLVASRQTLINKQYFLESNMRVKQGPSMTTPSHNNWVGSGGAGGMGSTAKDRMLDNSRMIGGSDNEDRASSLYML